MNWLKSADLAVTLDYAPGEFYGRSETVITSDSSADVLGRSNLDALDWTAEHYESLSQRSQLAHHIGNFLVAQDLFFWKPGKPLKRHAVNAPEIATIRNRNPQIFD
jgi:hypothetical protein